MNTRANEPMSMTLGELRDLAMELWNTPKGHHTMGRDGDNLIAHLHSEVSEVWEEMRRPIQLGMPTGVEYGGVRMEDRGVGAVPRMKPCGIATEIADVLLLTACIAGVVGLSEEDIDRAVRMKLQYWTDRELRW